jgi:dihydroxyacetone kinase
VLNFGVAAERLRAEGIDVRIVTVTDDVASASVAEPEKRRGIAGDLVVFKIAGAAAEAGLSIDDVERITRRANARTVSFGVAFDGCTLPGAAGPLFTVPQGHMALGLGIHGEPGISEEPIVTARQLAELLTGKLLAERPDGVTRVAALLNGLGATKYEELFVLWISISAILKQAGLELVAPEAGEYVTSLDMRGCSLTLLWLDDELENHWLAACDTPVLRRGRAMELEPAAARLVDEEGLPDFPPPSRQSQSDAQCIEMLVGRIAAMLKDAEDELGRIDAIAGDGDHGMGMRRGSASALEAAAAAVRAGAGAASTLASAGDAWADRAGGTSGALWGLLLRSWSSALSDTGAIDGEAVVRGARLALDGVVRLGGARIGDKTLVDAFIPFVEALEVSYGSGKGLAVAWSEAAEAAARAAEATSALTPKLGRARPLAKRSLGHPDAGAVSLAMAAKEAAAFLRDRS